MKTKTDLKKPSGMILSVVGTDTEVGKTIITAALALALGRKGRAVGVFKPFASDPARRASGEHFSTDADLLARAANLDGGWGAACGQLFEAPLAPFAAAMAEGRRVDPGAALRQARRMATQFPITLVEGCGGWEVPLTARTTTAEFFMRLGAPVVIVARAGLGTINHSLLTLEAIRRRRLPILGIILNQSADGKADPSEKTNAKILRSFAGVPVWGPVAFDPAISKRPLENVSVDQLPDLSSIVRAIESGLRRSQTSRR